MGRNPDTPEGPRGGAKSARFARRRALAAAVLVALSCAGLATAASAHHGQPATGEEEFGEANGIDTELTPVAKDGAQVGWEHIGGSKWQLDGSIDALVKDSPTPYDLDLFAVDFLDEENGFAAGAQCRRENPSEPVLPDEVADCERIPVIYRFRNDFERGLLWEEVYRGEDATDPGGFVGAITWLGPGRALAVGGTGTYPRREQELSEAQVQECRREEALAAQQAGPPSTADPAGAFNRALAECEGEARAQNDLGPAGAGMARAWLYESGSWREIEGLPSEIRALSALDSSPRPSDCGSGATECAYAGGMRQLWEWRNGEFTDGYGPELNPGQIDGVQNFRFRVREIRFAQSEAALNPDRARLVAVTSGCCAGTQSDDRPAWLWKDATAWHARTGGQSGPFNPDSYYSFYVQRTRQLPGKFSPGDSINIAMLRAAGGPSTRYELREPPSRFTGATTSGNISAGPTCDDEACAAEQTALPTFAGQSAGRKPAPGTTFSSLRLVSIDGDLANDWIGDWGVGSLLSSGQAIAYTTIGWGSRLGVPQTSKTLYPTPPLSKTPSTADPTAEGPCTEDQDQLIAGTGICTVEGYQKQNQSKSLFKLGSYALNAFRTYGEGSSGWAVGDHGAILRLGGGDALGAARGAPPNLGRSTPAKLPSGAAYNDKRPAVTDQPGRVPPLAGRPAEELPGPRFTPGETPDGTARTNLNSPNVKVIVMSRDGAEGWAFGNTGIYHYDGVRWSVCDPKGVPGLIAPDRECAAFAAVEPRTITDAARVPLENDKDPTNDDDFELVALRDEAPDTPLLRYRLGRWEIDRSASFEQQGFGLKGQDIVFTAPDDGWVLDDRSGAVTFDLYHYDGDGWRKCGGTDCDDPGRRLDIRRPSLSQGRTFMHLASAGERVYLHSIREARVTPSGAASAVDPTTLPYVDAA